MSTVSLSSKLREVEEYGAYMKEGTSWNDSILLLSILSLFKDNLYPDVILNTCTEEREPSSIPKYSQYLSKSLTTSCPALH